MNHISSPTNHNKQNQSTVDNQVTGGNMQGNIDRRLCVTEGSLITDKLITLAEKRQATAHEVCQVVELIDQAILKLPTSDLSLGVETGKSSTTDSFIDEISKSLLLDLNTKSRCLNLEANIANLTYHLFIYLETTPNENAPAIGRLIYQSIMYSR
jgi:hypothetical protein